jgi:hypothetical protein
MSVRNWARWSAGAIVALLLVGAAACGGGGTTTTGPGGGQIDVGPGNPPPLVIDGGIQYPGKQPPAPPTDQSTEPPTPTNNWVFGDNIFSVPIDTNGRARVVVSKFSPGQRVAFIAVNLNPTYLDAHDGATGSFPILPTSSFTIAADQIMKGASRMATPAELAAQTVQDLGSLADYRGLPYTGEVQSPLAIYEREARARGLVPYAPIPPVKTASSIQKGELRTFVNVPPTMPPPPIGPGPDNPDRDTSDLRWPYEYSTSQDGRLVAIGAHCLVYLSTEINYGHPDTIQFTEARLNALAREFDTKIFPIETAVFAPTTTYLEGNLFIGLDRTVLLTGDDFDDEGNLLTPLPGTVDVDIGKEKKVNIFVYNEIGGGGGFYVLGLSPTSQQALIDAGRQDDIERFAAVGSTLYISATNFPNNDDAWSAAYSVMAHEFQHKLFNDNHLPERSNSVGNYVWFNEGLSQMAIHVCGYTVNSGQIIDWAINGQLTDYLTHCNTSAIPMDGNGIMSSGSRYGSGFLFFLYLYEHYTSGLGTRIYDRARGGETNYIKLIEYATGEDFGLTYTKFAIANFIDGIYASNESTFSDPRFRYDTIDLRGTVNLWSGTIVLPGVRTSYFPTDGAYPIQSIDRLVYPWCTDYMVLTNGDGRDLEVGIYTDPQFKFYMLPVTYDAAQNAVTVTPNVTIN